MAIIEKLTSYCRVSTYLYGFWPFMGTILKVNLAMFKLVSSSSYRSGVKNGTESYIHLVNIWLPFDSNVLVRYIPCLAYETYFIIHLCGWFSSFDTVVITIMVFFKGELELLRVDSSQIFGTEDDPVTDEEALRRIKTCHKRHVLLMKYVLLFNKCLSHVMFFYLLVCSMVLCITVYQINIEIATEQIINSCFYLSFNLAQLVMFCWHANEVYYASTNLMYGPYESLWWRRSIKLRRNIHILSAQFNTNVILSAGPFTDLNVPTFISIIKGAYSYYTLLNQSQN